MSWQAYVDSQLLATKKVTKAAIHGHDGNVWATSAGFSVNNTEMATLIAAFKDPSGIRANGLRIGSVKYIALRADDRSIYGKSGSSGVVCVKTKQTILIGTYDDPIQPGEATKVVENLADFLINSAY
ncbi:Profilin conserved site domain-containing protein [Rozella allomycis CSF55]|uniref:Profilin n=1 Tax=Rozella allomycis (strain CSF55) TaxID=988480 RepID=A0A075AP74_ROZAC|nr:Profilin conserved site domain-containing protein [Rozella allomycis CSF55]|eukprot:EPZ31778.1 Profilin conserved site domain-containing protein [Rozella allomycis CSF55]